jgi:hypothetical protein
MHLLPLSTFFLFNYCIFTIYSRYCGSLPREPPTGYPKPVSKKQFNKQDFHGNQQMQQVLLRAVFSLESAWIRAFPWQPAENSRKSSPSDIDKDGREWKHLSLSMSEGELFLLFSAGCQGNARIQADPSENTARNNTCCIVGCHGNLVYWVVSWIPVLGNLWEVPVEGSHNN